MQQTSKYQFNLVDSTDDFSPAPLNQNMEKVEEELEGLEESLATVMETVDGHKLAVGSYQGNGGSQTINVGFTPKVVFVHNRRMDVTDGYQSGLAVTGSASVGAATVLSIVENGFQVTDYSSASLNFESYKYNYLALC